VTSGTSPTGSGSFGVGGYVSNADPVDFALDIVAVDGDPTAKRGKLPGVKQVYRTPDGDHHVGLARESGPDDGEALLQPLLRDGEVVADLDLGIDAAAERAARDAELCGYGVE
jgi:nicotinate phosphoribosyltransferase